MAEQIFEQNARGESDHIERATREAEQTFTAERLADMEARDAIDLEDDEVSGLDLAAIRGERIETLAAALRDAWRERDELRDAIGPFVGLWSYYGGRRTWGGPGSNFAMSVSIRSRDLWAAVVAAGAEEAK